MQFTGRCLTSVALGPPLPSSLGIMNQAYWAKRRKVNEDYSTLAMPGTFMDQLETPLPVPPPTTWMPEVNVSFGPAASYSSRSEEDDSSSQKKTSKASESNTHGSDKPTKPSPKSIIRKSPKSLAVPLSTPATKGDVMQVIKTVEKNTAKTEENTCLLHQVLRLMSGQTPDNLYDDNEYFDLPLDTISALEETNNALMDSTIFNGMVAQLGVIGGVRTADIVRRILAKIMTNHLATQINWKGTGDKKPFKDMLWRDVIVKATRSNPMVAMTTDAQIESHIKSWFRCARDRDGGRKERMLKAMQREAQNQQEGGNNF